MTNRPAFTLVELILGIAVSSIIFVSATSAYVFLLKTSSRQNQSQSLEQTKNDLIQELSNAIRWAPKDSIAPLSCLVVNGHEYKLESQSLTKDTRPLVPATIKVTNFTCTNYSPLANYQSLLIDISLEDTSVSPSRQGTLEFAVSQRQTDFVHSDSPATSSTPTPTSPPLTLTPTPLPPTTTPTSTPIPSTPTPTPTPTPVATPTPTSTGSSLALVNPGFETGNLTGWASAGTTVVSSPVHAGTKSASIVGKNYVSQNVKTLLATGIPYTFTMYSRVTAAATAPDNWGSPRLRVSQYPDLGTNTYGEAIAPAGVSSTWTMLQVTHTFTAAELAGNVYVGIKNFGFNGTVATDDLSAVTP